MRILAFAVLFLPAVQGASFFFSSGTPDGLMATASRPSSSGKIEIETADDFITTASNTNLTSGSFFGLLPTGAATSTVSSINVEIYRVFPNDSDTVRTINVNTRANSPSDIAFDSRDSAAGELAYTVGVLNSSFTAGNSVLNGINKKPNQNTGGEGPVSGQEVQINFTLTTPFSLPADHYFFVAQVELSNGDFYWLSSPRPAFTGDLQSWIRNANLDPDWSRVGTDIVGAGAFNAAFSLSGNDAPEPATWGMVLAGLAAAGLARSRRRS